MIDPYILEAENEVLCSRLDSVKAGAQDLVDAVKRYLRQECLRSELCNTLNTLETKLK